MNWKIADNRNRKSLMDLLVPEEWKYVPFSSRLKLKEPGCTILVRPDNRKVREAVMLTSYGQVIPLLDPWSEMTGEKDILKKVFAAMDSLHSIIGLRQDVEKIEKLTGKTPERMVNYYLMALRKEDWIRGKKRKGLNVRKATLKDILSLYPLQEMYEKEEVYLKPERFRKAQCLANLKNILCTQVTCLLEENKQPLAKAGTNARGFTTDQIGGVFTLPGKRGCGLGGLVMNELLFHIFDRKENASLFVRKENNAAIRLYEKLGFTVKEQYKITYYNL